MPLERRISIIGITVFKEKLKPGDRRALDPRPARGPNGNLYPARDQIAVLPNGTVHRLRINSDGGRFEEDLPVMSMRDHGFTASRFRVVKTTVSWRRHY